MYRLVLNCCTRCCSCTDQFNIVVQTVAHVQISLVLLFMCRLVQYCCSNCCSCTDKFSTVIQSVAHVQISLALLYKVLLMYRLVSTVVQSVAHVQISLALLYKLLLQYGQLSDQERPMTKLTILSIFYPCYSFYSVFADKQKYSINLL